jgi:hypothetical protein
MGLRPLFEPAATLVKTQEQTKIQGDPGERLSVQTLEPRACLLSWTLASLSINEALGAGLRERPSRERR